MTLVEWGRQTLGFRKKKTLHKPIGNKKKEKKRKVKKELCVKMKFNLSCKHNNRKDSRFVYILWASNIIFLYGMSIFADFLCKRKLCFFKVIKSSFVYETSKIILIGPFKIIACLMALLRKDSALWFSVNNCRLILLEETDLLITLLWFLLFVGTHVLKWSKRFSMPF